MILAHLSLIASCIFQASQLQVCLLAYTMAFQCALYLLYVGLFVLCHLVSSCILIIACISFSFNAILEHILIQFYWKLVC